MSVQVNAYSNPYINNRPKIAQLNNLRFLNKQADFDKISFTGRWVKYATLKSQSTKITNSYAVGTGLLTGATSQIPGVGAVVMSGLSTVMVRKLAKVYKIPWSRELTKSLAEAIGIENAAALATEVVGVIPIVGNIVDGAFCGLLQKVMGDFFQQHFENVSKGIVKHDQIDMTEFGKMLKDYKISTKRKLRHIISG